MCWCRQQLQQWDCAGMGLPECCDVVLSASAAETKVSQCKGGGRAAVWVGQPTPC